MNFCWLEAGTIAGCRGPRTTEDLQALRSLGIRSLVRLASSSETGIYLDDVQSCGLSDCYAPIHDFQAPTVDEANSVVRFLLESQAQGRPVAVSCLAGYGRTSTLLACYLIRKGLSACDAIDLVRSKCRREPENAAQRDFLSQFELLTRQG